MAGLYKTKRAKDKELQRLLDDPKLGRGIVNKLSTWHEVEGTITLSNGMTIKVKELFPGGSSQAGTI